MKHAFVNTKNHKRALALVNNLQERGEGVPGIGLIKSAPGFGKSTSLARLAATMKDLILVRAVSGMTQRWLLEAIAAELGLEPERRTKDLFHQCLRHLIDERRMLLIDEADYLMHSSIAIDTLRDLHDIASSVSLVLVGEEYLDNKLKTRNGRFYKRISQVAHFKPLDAADVAEAAAQMLEVGIGDGAVQAILERTGGVFREVMIVLNQAERAARASKAASVDGNFMKALPNARLR